ncbi:bifunctional riboflavin kinase/FAD synthetase [Clostridium hydrogeniformans]|uniref:bifunctional riboflavin kinase/FAD synthetase n=1 Tax=Clostridium hydrogeniformans TaxID=349933 RepID=UPI0004898DFD|nr:bifunctional riboflavin kinase/FAD synthetase [Clostridium hydrogeniformans]
MVIIDNNFSKELKEGTYVALGSFDGLHTGHRALINKAFEKAKINNCKSMVYTFKNHPLTVVRKGFKPELIMDNKSKAKLIESLGIDYVAFVEFNEEFMRLSPEEFIKMLLKKFNVRGIVVGFNYKFGYKNLGDIKLLKELSERLNFELVVIEAQSHNGEIISSSIIRTLIKNGEMERANEYLMEPFMMRGIVKQGKKLGRTLGFPTANLEYSKEVIIPGGGIYYTNIRINKKLFKAMTNIGYNPTVKGKELSIETFILDFNKDIYGEELEIYFIEKVRDEIKFNSLEELKAQLKKDSDYGKGKKLCLNL